MLTAMRSPTMDSTGFRRRKIDPERGGRSPIRATPVEVVGADRRRHSQKKMNR
jgi:hypothetical protein